MPHRSSPIILYIYTRLREVYGAIALDVRRSTTGAGEIVAEDRLLGCEAEVDGLWNPTERS